MSQVASFTFHGSLQDFLKPSMRHKPVSYTFTGTPAVKDAIEAIGVPHPEVAFILKNGVPVRFSEPLHPQDTLHIYPVDSEEAPTARHALVDIPPRPIKFILDVHLGTLAKALRMLGFDTVYEKQLDDAEIAAIAAAEHRIVLTRDVGLLKHRIVKHGYWLRSQKTAEQLQEVIKRYNLTEEFTPFMRCLRCNSLVEAVAKEQVLHRLPPKTRLYFNEFYLCAACDKVYWKGSHYEHMKSVVDRIKN